MWFKYDIIQLRFIFCFDNANLGYSWYSDFLSIIYRYYVWRRNFYLNCFVKYFIKNSHQLYKSSFLVYDECVLSFIVILFYFIENSDLFTTLVYQSRRNLDATVHIVTVRATDYSHSNVYVTCLVLCPSVALFMNWLRFREYHWNFAESWRVWIFVDAIRDLAQHAFQSHSSIQFILTSINRSIDPRFNLKKTFFQLDLVSL